LRVRVDRFPNQPNRRTHTRSLRNLGLTAEISPELVSRLVGKKKPSSTIVTQRFSSLMRVYRTFPPLVPYSALSHLYRAMAFLGDAIEQLEKPTCAVRCNISCKPSRGQNLEGVTCLGYSDGHFPLRNRC
jgi:hypothetical protein